jgi:hypothetical protein
MKRETIIAGAVAIAVLAGGTGYAVGHLTAPKTVAAMNPAIGGFSSGPGLGGARRSGGRPVFGTVASLSGNTLVITDASGASHTVTLSATTNYTAGDGSVATQTNLTQGTRVAAFGAAASDGAVTATRIIVNPSLPGGSNSGASSTPSGSTQAN